MFYGLITLNWFDTITVGITVVTFVLVQILNAIWSTLDDNTVSGGGDTITKTTIQQQQQTSDNNDVTKSLKINELKSLISNDSTTIITNDFKTNGKLHKQQSEQTDKYVLKLI